MGSKRYVTSKAPTNNVKGGLDAIISGGVYAKKTGKGRRQNKKRRGGIAQVGGTAALTLDHTRKHFTVKEKDIHGNECVHEGVLKATTTVESNNETRFEARIAKKLVVLGDESTYTQGMLDKKYEDEISNPQKHMTTHKVTMVTGGRGKTGVLGQAKKTSGRRVIRNKGKVN